MEKGQEEGKGKKMEGRGRKGRKGKGKRGHGRRDVRKWKRTGEKER